MHHFRLIALAALYFSAVSVNAKASELSSDTVAARAPAVGKACKTSVFKTCHSECTVEYDSCLDKCREDGGGEDACKARCSKLETPCTDKCREKCYTEGCPGGDSGACQDHCRKEANCGRCSKYTAPASCYKGCHEFTNACINARCKSCHKCPYAKWKLCHEPADQKYTSCNKACNKDGPCEEKCKETHDADLAACRKECL
ncbi:hypothetical protein BOTBODRAFT_174034 [Botryobasidium botryosum FD-172 SS1]|uniref:TNFR-Cys domain-containing protein n=1 Tax=Botryobasidium botryosum (strain FD-172 SS1) TaxID=930990 RepID=A0A067MTI8_BOTB1|nr:hypothetical protein BOTBODRAFT_174034 [Botryobasidium botryosum FD-172 SS1]